MEFKLTEKQELALEYMKQGKNIFLTGPSGTGKSVLIHAFKKLYGKDKIIAVTSTTGISALLIEGTTLHSYLGLGIGDTTVDKLVSNIRKKSYLKTRWLKLNVLIIDEISMLSPELFDIIENTARIIRTSQVRLLDGKNNSIKELPFGGIQLILCGDFLQLPVVGNPDFCFEAKSWNSCVDHIVYLTEIMRQDDVEFQQVLNDIRYGNVTEKAKKLLNSRLNVDLKNELGIKPTKIHTLNIAVDQINEQELDLLAETYDVEFHEYIMDIYFYKYVKDKEYAINRARKNCLAPDKLQLCEHAQVMLLYNLDQEQGLVNGSRGVVTGFTSDLPVVKFLNGIECVIDYHSWEIEEEGKKYIKITQLPLKVAYAVTSHKIQGATLDYAEVDLSNVFEYGQAYVALSRVKNMSGLSIVDIDYKAIRAHPKAVQFYKNLN